MSTHDYIIADGSGSAVLSDMNNAFQALASNNKSSTVPGTLYDGMWRLNDSTTPWRMEIYDGTDWIVAFYVDSSGNLAYPFGAMSKETGIWLSNNSSDADHDIDFSAGTRLTQNNYMATLGSTMTKRLDAAWSSGSGNGGLDTGSIAADTSYHGYVIVKDSDLSTDAIMSTSATGPTMPSGYTEYRRRGAFCTDSSANILAFQQNAERTTLYTPVLESTSVPAGSGTQYTITIPNNIKTIVLAVAAINAGGTASNLTAKMIEGYTTLCIIGGAEASGNWAGSFQVTSDTSQHITLGYSTSAPSGFNLWTVGWIDYQLAMRL